LEDQAVFVSEFYFTIKGVSPQQLQELYNRQFTRLVQEELVIFDENRNILFESSKTHNTISNIEVDELFKGKQLELELDNGIEMSGLKVAHNGKSYYVIVSALDRYGKSKLEFLRVISFVVMSASIILMVLAGLVFANRTLRPIALIIDQVNKITSSSLNTRVYTANQRDEIAKLATTFNEMLAGLEEAFALNKSFVQHASHELRTPLTSIRGQLEVALMHPRTPEEYQQTMVSLLEDIVNMTKLTNGLLELSQLSTSTFQPKFEPVRVDALLWDMVDVITEVKPEYRISIEFDPETDENDLIVNGNQTWLGNCFKNLMENGCKFSQAHRVLVSLKPKKNWLVISFTDHGYGIVASEIEHIFEPFYRSENTLHIQGHGIGLSLCKKIVHLHNGLIDVKSQIGASTTFSVRLPLTNALPMGNQFI
jgi:signal transduction histidine kinase